MSLKNLRDCIIGMAGPLALHDLRSFLPPEGRENEYPQGLGGSPVGLLSAELLKRGHRLVIFSLDPNLKEEEERVIEGDNVKICFGSYSRRPIYNFRHSDRRYLTEAILRERPDFIHTQWTYEFALATIATGLPHLVTAHDAPWNILRYNHNPYRIARTVMAYQACRAAQRVVAVSPHVAGHLKRFGFHSKQIDVIPNGMPSEVFARIRTKASADGITYATILAGWAGLKNGPAAIAAFAKVRRQLPAARLLMFGADHGAGEAADIWAHKHGLEDGIEFAGKTPHPKLIDRLSQEVDVLVHPSFEEAQPLAVIEAMSFGIPVIGGKTSGGVPWTLGYGENGVLVDVRSPDGIAEAMLRLGKDESERIRLGLAGQSLAKARFRIERVADQYEAIYAQVANGKL